MNPYLKIIAPALLSATLAFPALAANRSVVPAKSEIGFSVKQMGVAVSGRFTRYSAQINLDAAKPEASSAEVTVEIASLDTGDGDADAIALDKPWLDKLGFPKAVFKSTAVRALGGGKFEADGTLSIRGKSRPVTVPFTTQDQADKSTVVTGQFTIKRADFGIGGGEWNQGDLVANEVPVKFKLTLAP